MVSCIFPLSTVLIKQILRTMPRGQIHEVNTYILATIGSPRLIASLLDPSGMVRFATVGIKCLREDNQTTPVGMNSPRPLKTPSYHLHRSKRPNTAYATVPTKLRKMSKPTPINLLHHPLDYYWIHPYTCWPWHDILHVRATLAMVSIFRASP
jgi:hypothetical protein